MSLFIESEWALYGFMTGTATQEQAEIAVQITEDMFEIGLNTALMTGTATELHTWPGYSLYRGLRPLQMDKDRIISIDSVAPQHDVGCAFADIEVTIGEGLIKHAESGIIEIRDDCYWCCPCKTCSYGVEAFQVEITYTYGFGSLLDADTSWGKIIRFWIAKWAHEMLNSMLGLPSVVAEGDVEAWSSMSYSERRGSLAMTPFGDSKLANAMWSQLRGLSVKRAIKFGGRR